MKRRKLHAPPLFNRTPSLLTDRGFFTALKLKRKGKENESFNDNE
jgi:hypothetical protein